MALERLDGSYAVVENIECRRVAAALSHSWNYDSWPTYEVVGDSAGAEAGGGGDKTAR